MTQQRTISRTVKPVLSGPPLSRHPALSRQFAKYRIESHINHTSKTFIKRTPLLSKCGHLNTYKNKSDPGMPLCGRVISIQ